MTSPMQVDRIFSTEAPEAEITIKQNKKKTERGSSIQWKGDPALSYNGANTANRKHSFKSSAINGRQREARKRDTADAQMEKGEKRWLMNIWNY